MQAGLVTDYDAIVLTADVSDTKVHTVRHLRKMNKENTFRALADQPLVVERWLCRFGWHRWSRWDDLELMQGYGAKYKTSRKCVSCNWTQKKYRVIPS